MGGILAAGRHRLAGFSKRPSHTEKQACLGRLLAEAAHTFGENNHTPADETFIQQGIVGPALSFCMKDMPLRPIDRHNLLIALGSGDFRLYLALRLLDCLE